MASSNSHEAFRVRKNNSKDTDSSDSGSSTEVDEDPLPSYSVDSRYQYVPAERIRIVSPSGIVVLRCTKNSVDGVRANRCEYKKPGTRKRCTQAVHHVYNLCDFHLREKFGIEVAPSQIPNAGLGLFARAPRTTRSRRKKAAVIPKDGIVCHYEGEVLTKKKLNERYPGDYIAPYVFVKTQGRRNVYVDGVCKRFAPAYINAALNRQSNVIFLSDGSVVAKRNIYEGEELLIHYGTDYWVGETKSHSGNKVQRSVLEAYRVESDSSPFSASLSSASSSSTRVSANVIDLTLDPDDFVDTEDGSLSAIWFHDNDDDDDAGDGNSHGRSGKEKKRGRRKKS